MTEISRRAAIGALGVGATLGAAGGAAYAFGRDSPPSVTAAGPPQITVADWVAGRGDQYYIGHRGSADVYPEHSMEGYQAAVDAGARCLEISVASMSDGVLVCMHDATLDRTTNATGSVAALPSTVLRGVRLHDPSLGPAWANEPVPQVPRFLDVLRTFGGRVILCVEAKNDDDYPAVLAAVEANGLQSSVIIKAFYSSPRIKEARSSGYPVFAYFGVDTDVTAARITALGQQLDGTKDYIILPTAGSSDGYLDPGSVRQAVATGVTVWVYACHRRSDAAHYFALGCRGIVAPSLGYLSSQTPSAVADTWTFGAIAPGEMTRDPAVPAYDLSWSGNELELRAKGTQHFVTLGQFGPLAHAADSYRIAFEAAWPQLPLALTDNLTLAFGRIDDSYYEHRLGRGNGYHAILRANGSLELFRHDDGKPDGVALGTVVQTPAPKAGQWLKFELTVTPTGMTWSRTDDAASAGAAASSVSAADRSYRGGYLHLGRSSADGVLAFRSLTVH